MTANTTDRDNGSCSAPYQISEGDLLADLQTLAEQLGRAPRVREVQSDGEHSVPTYLRRFGSWENALRKAGLYDEFERSKFDGAEHHIGTLVDEMVRVATIVGRPPTETEIDELGEFSHNVYQSTFGSWAEALRTCGFPPRYRGGTLRPPKSQRPIYGENWDEQRRRALYRDGHQCQHCGVTIEEIGDRPVDQLQVHHIVPIRQFDEPELGNHLLNLITLCPECHRTWESSRPVEIDIDELESEIRESTGGYPS
ncbi:homing endonuclease associated repeat-containing protein [Haloarcula halophila]|uniref:homing endonuclease associated repeat-containing protein n=1 Tax=Halomicroarcula sp. GCM10025335 TaxID=3252668 RepID=UPI0036185DDA